MVKQDLYALFAVITMPMPKGLKHQIKSVINPPGYIAKNAECLFMDNLLEDRHQWLRKIAELACRIGESIKKATSYIARCCLKSFIINIFLTSCDQQVLFLIFV